MSTQRLSPNIRSFVAHQLLHLGHVQVIRIEDAVQFLYRVSEVEVVDDVVEVEVVELRDVRVVVLLQYLFEHVEKKP